LSRRAQPRSAFRRIRTIRTSTGTWTVTDDSTVTDTVTNAGLVEFVPPGGGPFHTLTTQNYVGLGARWVSTRSSATGYIPFETDLFGPTLELYSSFRRRPPRLHRRVWLGLKRLAPPRSPQDYMPSACFGDRGPAPGGPYLGRQSKESDGTRGLPKPTRNPATKPRSPHPLD
jgi:hypothetical protein